MMMGGDLDVPCTCCSSWDDPTRGRDMFPLFRPLMIASYSWDALLAFMYWRLMFSTSFLAVFLFTPWDKRG